MAIDLNTHMQRVAATLEKIFPNRSALWAAETAPAFVKREVAGLSDEVRHWLPHDTPLDTALTLLRVDARHWERANGEQLLAYDQFAAEQGWNIVQTSQAASAEGEAPSSEEGLDFGEEEFDLDEFIAINKEIFIGSNVPKKVKDDLLVFFRHYTDKSIRNYQSYTDADRMKIHKLKQTAIVTRNKSSDNSYIHQIGELCTKLLSYKELYTQYKRDMATTARAQKFLERGRRSPGTSV